MLRSAWPTFSNRMLHFRPKLHTIRSSRMRKIFLGLFASVAFCSLLTGCNSVQGYSLRSYQGPLPMEDYRYVTPETYGVPGALR